MAEDFKPGEALYVQFGSQTNMIRKWSPFEFKVDTYDLSD